MTDARLGKGLAWLDEHFPDWLDRVNADRIDMTAPALCPVGQAAVQPELCGWCAVTGTTALRRRRHVPDDFPRLTHREASGMGFLCAPNEAGPLGTAWQRFIAELKEERADG